MKPAIPYLALPGTCADAMAFYADMLDAEITIVTTMADAPIDVPPEARQMIFNSELRAGDLVIKASDNPSRADVGSTISLFLTFDATDSAEIKQRQAIMDKLADGGEYLFGPDGPFAMIRDRFGVQWMLNLE